MQYEGKDGRGQASIQNHWWNNLNEEIMGMPSASIVGSVDPNLPRHVGGGGDGKHWNHGVQCKYDSIVAMLRSPLHGTACWPGVKRMFEGKRHCSMCAVLPLAVYRG